MVKIESSSRGGDNGAWEQFWMRLSASCLSKLSFEALVKPIIKVYFSNM